MPLHPVIPVIGVAAGLILAAAAIRFIRAGHNAITPEAVVCDGIARHAELYSGLYEGLCQILAREEVSDRDTLKEWCSRTAGLEAEPEYTAAFSQLFGSAIEAPEPEYREKLSLLLKLIGEAGIIRSGAGTLTYEPSVQKSYLYLGEGTPADGEVYCIIKPCWTCGGKAIEQGVIMKGGLTA